MRRTVGTDLQEHGSMKDAQGILRHASIKTTANVYMQQIPASVRAALNSRTRAILPRTGGVRRKTLTQCSPMLPNWRKGWMQVLKKIGSSGRTRTYNPP